MTEQLIDLGVLDAHGSPGRAEAGLRLPSRWRRSLVAAVLAVVTLFIVGASTPGPPVLGEPFWTGPMSGNGFSLGADSVLLTPAGGNSVISLDAATGARRWSFDMPDLPDYTADLGGGVFAVSSRPLGDNGVGNSSVWPEETITFVRGDTGEMLGQTIGYAVGSSPVGRPVLVLRDRPRNDSDCPDVSVACVQVSGWNVSTAGAALAWQVSPPAGTSIRPAYSDGHADGFLVIGPDGSVATGDLSSGAMGGTIAAPASDGPITGTMTNHDTLVLGQRDDSDVVVTAYRRPSLDRLWSVRLAAPPPQPDPGLNEYVALADCGAVVCLNVAGRTNRLIDLATGRATATLDAEVIFRLGSGSYLATPGEGTTTTSNMYVVDRDNRIVATIANAGFVQWDDSAGRGLLTQFGQDRTGFVVVDDRGGTTAIGSVPGVRLSCVARGDVLACLESGGPLRLWHLPV